MSDLSVLLIAAAVIAGLFILLSTVFIIGIGWTHYPYGSKHRKKNYRRKYHHE